MAAEKYLPMSTSTRPHHQPSAAEAPSGLSRPAQERVLKHLVYLYGRRRAEELLERVGVVVHRHCEQHRNRFQPPLWDERDVALITYGNTIQSGSEVPLQTLGRFVTQHLKEAISTVHLLPIFPYSSDDGFSVIDYRSVDPELGKWEDVETIGEHFKLALDFVLNHVSRDSLWFADFLEHMPPGNAYFLELDPDTDLRAVVRPRSSPLLTRVRTRHTIRHVWSTFSKDQIDLNYENPDVLLQALEILLYYIQRGARIIRLDAVAFLWKEIGTRCVHLPQTHRIVKFFRDILDEVEPGVALLTETNVPHKENISYFGDADEAHMVYQFTLPPLTLHAIHAGTTRCLRRWLADLAPPPPGCTMLNFTASHDGIGMRPLEGLLSESEINRLIEAMRLRGAFVSTRLREDGSEGPYEINISYADAFRDPDAVNDNWHIPRFMLSQTLALTLQGVPAVYIHSLTATSNDHAGVERTGQTRSINRRRWDIHELERLLGDEQSTTTQVFNCYRRLLALRRRLKAFHPDGAQAILDLGDELLGIVRTAPDDSAQIVALFNFTPLAHNLPLSKLADHANENERWHDLIADDSPRIENGELILAPYSTLWLHSAAEH